MLEGGKYSGASRLTCLKLFENLLRRKNFSISCCERFIGSYFINPTFFFRPYSQYGKKSSTESGAFFLRLRTNCPGNVRILNLNFLNPQILAKLP